MICHSGSERHDGHHDAGSRFRHPRRRRSDVLCRDHEVRPLAFQFLRKRGGEPYSIIIDAMRGRGRGTGTSSPWSTP